MVTAALSCVKSKQCWKKSTPEGLRVPVGTGTFVTVMRGSSLTFPGAEVRRKGVDAGRWGRGAGVLLLHTRLGSGLGMAAEQEIWPAMLSPAQHPESGRCHPEATWMQGPRCAFRIAVVWCLARWSQYLPCNAELQFSYTFFSFSLPLCNPG